MKRFLEIFGAVSLVVIMLAVTVGAYRFFAMHKETSETDNQKVSSSEETPRRESTNKCSDAPVFDNEFTDFDKIEAFGTIGSLSGASRGRSYITVKKGEMVPVYAPMDATLISLIYAYRGPNADHGEYGFQFDAGCGVIFLLDHIDTISDELKKYAPVEPSHSTATNGSLRVAVKGGILLGYTNGTPQARTFDFLVLDEKYKAYHINPARWQWNQSVSSVCPYDFFISKLKERYYQKLGEPSDRGLIKSDGCGQISYDVKDTVSGGWFANAEATDMKGKFLLVGERMGAVDLVVKSDSEGTQLRITDNNFIKAPQSVGIGKTVCYSNNMNFAFLKLESAERMEAVFGSGQCPVDFPFGRAEVWQR